MKLQDLKKKRKNRRKFHVRKNIFGTPDKLRLTVFRSDSHIYAQIIDDVEGKTIVSASSIDKEVKGMLKPDMKKQKQSELIGSVLAKRALEKNIKKVQFDRNGFLYHGRIKALADAARKGGLEF